MADEDLTARRGSIARRIVLALALILALVLIGAIAAALLTHPYSAAIAMTVTAGPMRIWIA